MKKLCIYIVLLISWMALRASSSEEIWRQFRDNHPFGFQTVGLGHTGDESVFIVTEPSESVKFAELQDLFGRYEGVVERKRYPFGYDGWLGDAVGTVRFRDADQEREFTIQLFKILYGTDYKGYCTDLDMMVSHTYFAPYKYKLNYSVTPSELEQWLISAKLQFGILAPDGGMSSTKTIPDWLGTSVNAAGGLLYSSTPGFVVWLVNPSMATDIPAFRENARKFALDTDLIIGAFGKKGENVAIVARERQIPVDILPPLRPETIALMATTDNEHLGQSYERFHVFAAKLSTKEDVAPIYLSDELWHTEYGNLLNLTDQMLKSWSENGNIDYKEFPHPKPFDWAFDRGVLLDLGTDRLTYNWNTAGAGFVVEGERYDIYAVNRTGSLPVSFIPGGMEGKVSDSVYEAEEMAYDFFSNLNSPELARVVQYATLYQIFNYFDNPKVPGVPNKTVFHNSHAPDYSWFERQVERLLKVAYNLTVSADDMEYAEGLERFRKRSVSRNAHSRLQNLISTDPYGRFGDYIANLPEGNMLDKLLHSFPTDEEIEEEFRAYLMPNLDTVCAYINNYEGTYGSFPFKDAARFIISPRNLENEIREVLSRLPEDAGKHIERVESFNTKLQKLQADARKYDKEVDAYNAKVKEGKATLSDNFNLYLEESRLKVLYEEIQKEEKELKRMGSYLEGLVADNEKEAERLASLAVSPEQQQALGALNWLLTDPGEYDEPSGPFFSTRLTGHSEWLKSPSMACSFNGSGYGGHNLDAHITPVKNVGGLAKGKGMVSFVGGRRVVSVGKEDIPRVTKSFLRKVERRTDSEGIVDLPAPLPDRDPSVLLGSGAYDARSRGFDLASHTESATEGRQRVSGNNTLSTEAGLLDEMASPESSMRNVTVQPYSERELLVRDGDREFIVERSDGVPAGYSEMVKFDCFAEGQDCIVEFDDVVAEIPQRVRFTFPGMSGFTLKIEEAVNTFKGKIHNFFQFKHHVRRTVDEDLMMDFEMGVERNLFAPAEVMQEWSPFSVIIFKQDDKEYVFMEAA